MTELTTAQLLAEYNQIAAELGRPRVNRFSDRKTAERRLAAIRAERPPVEPPVEDVKPVPDIRPRPVRESAPSAKFNPRKSDGELADFMRAGVARGLTSAAAVREAIQQFPNATRVQVKHSAGVAGINPLTARNMFDKMRKA